MSRLFQIEESDLAELERTLPELSRAAWDKIDNRQRVQWRRIQAILTNVRWDYGPPTNVEIIPGG